MLKDGYKQTELGLIPEDWEVKSFEEIAIISRGASPRPIQSPIWFDNNSSIGWVRISDVTKSGKYLFQTEQKLSTLGVEKSRFVEANNLIMSICATLGRPILTSFDVCIHDGFVVFKNLAIEKNYMYYYLRYIQNQWAESGQVGTQVNLNTYLINNTKIPIPSKKEQKAIAKALSDTDELITSLEKLISKKEAIKQGTMQQLLTGKKRLSGFTGDWEEKKLGDIANFLKGKGLPKSALSNDGKYKCIHYGELFTTYKEIIKHIKSFTNQCEDTILSIENDILMPTSDVTPNGLATASCIQENGIILGGDILIIRANKNILDGCFFSFYISIDKNQIMQLISGSTVYHLYGSDMANFIFKLPPTIEEQKAISEILSDMDNEIETLKQKLTKTKAIKDGIMSELLTGKTRLKVKDE